jgi:transposase
LKIKQYDRQIQQLGQTEYPETQALLKVHGVGHLTALTFVLTLGCKERFGRSRDVGCYLGLRPRRSQSGDHDPQLGIPMPATHTSEGKTKNKPLTPVTCS